MANTTSTTSWFRPEEFESSDFDPNSYIERNTATVPLDKLLVRLQQHVDTIRADLIDVINADYPLFIQMADKLKGVEGSALQIQTPLLKLKDALADLQGRYQDEQASLKECLERQAQVQHTKSMLELVQDAMAVMGKLESLTTELPDISASESSVDPAAAAAQVERIASEVSRLAFYMTEGSSIPVIQGLGPRVSSVTSKLRTVIMAALKTALSASNQTNDTAASSCIHASSLIMDMEAAYTALQDCLIDPAVARAMSASANSAPNEVVRLPAFLNAAQSELEPQITRMNAMLSHHPDLASSFDLLGTCVLRSVHSAIKTTIPGCFSPAVPDAFHRNYTSAMAFISWLEDKASTEGALQLLHDSEPRSVFGKAWNLAVYFSLQFQEIARSFDSHLHSAPADAPADATCKFVQTQAVLDSMRRCRDDSVTFPAVYDRFLKLQMQIVHRYGCWLREAQDTSASRGTEGQQGQARATPPPNADASTAGQPQAGAGQDEAQNASSMQQWAKAASPENLVVVLADAWKLAERLQGPETEAISAQLLPVTSQSALERSQEAMRSAVSRLIADMSGAEGLIVKQMLGVASSWLRHVKSIATAYRRTGRPAPTKPSHYAAPLLKAPAELSTSASWQQLPPEAQQKLMLRIIEDVTRAFKAAAVELIDTITKTQASLSKIGRVGNPAGGTSDGPSDIEKMQEQLRLDVIEYGAAVERLLKYPASQLSTYEELLQVAQQPIDSTVVSSGAATAGGATGFGAGAPGSIAARSAGSVVASSGRNGRGT